MFSGIVISVLRTFAMSFSVCLPALLEATAQVNGCGSGTLDRGKDTVELTRLQVLLALPCCGWPIVSSDYMTCGCSSLITRNGRGGKEVGLSFI